MEIMKLTDFTQNTLDNIKKTMDFNGYSWFNEANYKAKNNTPCFIPENGEDMTDVYSWQRMFKEGLEIVKTKEFLEAVFENYNKDTSLLSELSGEEIDFEDVYLEVTGITPEKFTEDFMDNYFLGGEEVWCYLSTKFYDYMM